MTDTKKAWFRIKYLDEFKLFFFTIETSHSESRFTLTINQTEKLIKALQDKNEIIFEV